MESSEASGNSSDFSDAKKGHVYPTQLFFVFSVDTSNSMLDIRVCTLIPDVFAML